MGQPEEDWPYWRTTVLREAVPCVWTPLSWSVWSLPGQPTGTAGLIGLLAFCKRSTAPGREARERILAQIEQKLVT